MAESTGKGVRSGRSQEMVGAGSPSAVQMGGTVTLIPTSPNTLSGSAVKVGGTEKENKTANNFKLY